MNKKIPGPSPADDRRRISFKDVKPFSDADRITMEVTDGTLQADGTLLWHKADSEEGRHLLTRHLEDKGKAKARAICGNCGTLQVITDDCPHCEQIAQDEEYNPR